ncbi:MAG: GNAT family N-acetyltransferase [candidate division WS1 bacterium]|nr:GNAT family N-acetyltransferase [candidate division WS1 bacterium]
MTEEAMEHKTLGCVSRLAAPEDIPVLAIFERELARLSFPEDPILDLEYHEEKLRRAMEREPQGMIVQCVAADDAPAGDEVAAWMWLSTRRTLATSEAYGVLRSLYVRQRYRRHGLALSLAEYALRYFASQDVKKIVAKVHAENKPAMQVLRQIGFGPLHTTLQFRLEPGAPYFFDEDEEAREEET